MPARQFRFQVEDFVKNPTKEAAESLYKTLHMWRDNHKHLLALIKKSPILKEVEPLSQTLALVAGIGIEAVNKILNGEEVDKQWREKSLKALTESAKPMAHADIAVIPAIRSLIEDK